MSDILEQAHALGRAILETDAYRAMQEAKAAWERDEEAQRLEREQNACTAAVRAKMIRGMATREEMEEMLACGERLEACESVRRYNEASDAFSDLKTNVYQILALYLGEGGGGCAGCGGCAKR